ncbi:bifunctional anthranilate synthase component I family protein/aminotransferase class IV [Ralstonia solanacearum]|uniref:bifunctional chorismate-binding protein/class IV aminotransferase n=1 Tax=Ralstonia solanacearum TaxID=305 RepID=UPI001B3B40FC|nr:bifunctional anthranilate synthase component I family protein/class IV aminotransferase [Ralstonia solanacearum]AST33083.2 bifunctional anthranilate synthase component I family protein/aminotransferase class IV [Ralstonia solanacearum]MDB0507116.1 bifunctional anthranilate synthase component I family protein/aminotransferase class IV [Ralstonia solanacearum]MDB0513236.1 bifunctional anthranilate synthase component I family protein/aminotransferase class IV [Ralstonia solanacearum]
MQSPDAGAPFALLDDATSAGAPCSRWYTGYAGEIVRPPGRLEGLDDALRGAWAEGLHALVMAPYAFGRPLVGLAQANPASAPSPFPLPGHDSRLRVLLFRSMQVLSAAEVEALFDAWPEAGGAAGLFDCAASVDHDAYVRAIARIQDWIAAGDTYEVNYTYRLRMTAFGAPVALYRRLRARQPVPYGALIGLPEGGAVLSCSPELFFSHRAGSLVARPMKGTAPASGDPEVDETRAVALAADEKNRAENLMIVDLLRNDLGRLARPGSVRVPALFEVTPYGSVLQMTSTVQAQIPPETGLADCFAALFPCGSITGAPKRRTMEIIDALEPEPRGLYTGAIGWIDAPVGDRAMGDACFSVAIRTLVLGAAGTDGLRAGELGIGSGIVYDSVADDEYAECRLKARFVTALDPGLSLFETMRATRAEGVPLLDRHLARLEHSARAFGFGFDRDALVREIAHVCAALPEDGAHRMRLSLQHSGAFSVTAAPLSPLPAAWDAPVRLHIAPQAREAVHSLPHHKTSLRAAYDAAWQAAEREGAFDAVFFNADGTLAEGGRSTVLVKLEGQWWTPPLSAGVLPGVMRGVLLDDARPWLGAPLHERVLTRAEVARAEAIAVCNALRGVVPAHFEPPLA